jgi:hypothetical protein
MRALECKEVLNNTFPEIIDKDNQLIRDIELGRT